MHIVRLGVHWGFVLCAGFLLGLGAHRTRWYDFYWVVNLTDQFAANNEERYSLPYWQFKFYANAQIAKESCEGGLYAVLEDTPLPYVCPEFR